MVDAAFWTDGYSDRLIVDDDFVGARVNASGDLVSSGGAWNLDSSSVGTPLLQGINGESHAPGIMRVSTSTTLGDSALAILGNSFIMPGDQIKEVQFRCRMSSVTGIKVQIGLFDAAPISGATTGRWMSFDSATDSTFKSVTRVSNTSNILAMGAVTTAWRRFRFVDVGRGRLSWSFECDQSGGLNASPEHASQFVDSTPLFFGIRVETRTGGASAHVDVDRIRIRSIALTR